MKERNRVYLVLAAVGLYFILHPSSFILCAQEPPLAGRPANFSNLVGSYRITSSASPTEVRVEEPLLLTVRISGQGPAEYQPRREHLRLFPEDFSQQFYVEALPEQDRQLPQEKAWEFAWRLRPKHQNVKEIPALELVYFRSAKYQTSLTAPIALQVKARPEVSVKVDPEIVAARELPPRFCQWHLGLEVPWPPRSFVFGGPTWWWLVLGCLPPLVCSCWYWSWRRNSEARMAINRTGQAARWALQALVRPDKAADVVYLVNVVDEYLRRRFDFPAAEPTPTEAARHLFKRGLPRPLTQRLADFFQACAAVRFAPGQQPEPLVDEAVQLILALEAKSCVLPPG